MPPPQAAFENAYHDKLQAGSGVLFNRLLMITNMPIAQFLRDNFKKKLHNVTFAAEANGRWNISQPVVCVRDHSRTQ